MPLQELTREFAEAIARQHPTLETLSLARNALTSVPFLDLLPPLRRLDLSANGLRALPAETAQWGPTLAFLDLSDNALESLQQLRFCRALETLRAGGNRIALFSELKYLQSLNELQDLTLERNPIAQQPFYRREVVAMLPQLVRLDGRPVTPAERLVASLQQKPQVVVAPPALPPRTTEDEGDDGDAALDLSGTSHVWATPESPLGRSAPSESPSVASSVASSVRSQRRPLLTPASLHQTAALPSRPTAVDVSVQAASTSVSVASEPVDNQIVIAAPKREPEALLQSRVTALESIVALQDTMLTDEFAGMGSQSPFTAIKDPERAACMYVKLLATWRHKVVALLVQLQTIQLEPSPTNSSVVSSDAIECAREDLTRQLDVWKQKCTDALAQRDLERVRVAQADRERQSAETKVVRVVRTLATERERVQSIAEHVAIFAAKDGGMTTHMDALAHETQRLAAFETRLRLLSERLHVASRLVAHREARLRNSEAAIEVERRVLRHKTSDASSSARKTPLLLVRPATEQALRLVFHRLDPYHTGLVTARALLEAIRQDLAVRDALGGGDSGVRKRVKLVERMETQIRDRSSVGGIGGTLTWGEVVLLFMPAAERVDGMKDDLTLTVDDLGVPPPFDTLPAAEETTKTLRWTKRDKQALQSLSKAELVALVTELRRDREQLQRRVLEDAHHLQRRVALVEQQWEHKVSELVRTQDELHDRLTRQTERATETQTKLEAVERAAGEAQYQLQSLRRQLSEQAATFAQQTSDLEAQRVESLEREQQVWQRELQDMAFQQTQLKAENAKLELSVRQLERELAKQRDQHERNESVRAQRLDEKVAKRDDEIAKLRRERNTLLSALREQEKKLALPKCSTTDTTDTATQTEGSSRSIGVQVSDTSTTSTATTKTTDRRMQLDEIAVPTAAKRVHAHDLQRRLQHLESLTESLLAE